MRITQLIFAGSIAALAALAAPTLAKNSETQTSDERQTSPSCHAYQLGPDGTWQQLPCQEMGTDRPTQHKAAPRGSDEETR
jgi:hypothetical protein